MGLNAKDILDGFDAPVGVQGPSDFTVTGEELRQSIIEEQVKELRQKSAKGEKPSPITPKVPNPKQEELTGSKQPRVVGFPENMLVTGAEAAGGTGGAMAGAARGAQLGAPFGPYGMLIGGVGGGIIGAGLGVAGTRAAIETGQSALGYREPISADEAITRAKRGFVEGAAGEGAGRLLGTIPQLKHYLGQRLLAGTITPEMRTLGREAQQIGIHLSPSTLTESKAPKLVEHTLRRTMAGGGKFEARDILNELSLRQATDEWADRTLGKYLGPIEQGVLVQKAIKNKAIPEHYEMVKALYKNLDDQTGGAKIVPTGELYTSLLAIRQSLARRGDAHKDAIATLDDVLQRMSQEGPVTGITVERDVEALTKMIPGKSKAKVKKDITQPSYESVERGKKPYDKGFVTPEESQLKGITTSTKYQEIPTGEEQLKHLTVTEKSRAPRQPIPLTFQEAQEIRHIIGTEIGGPQKPLPDANVRMLKTAYAKMTEQMGEAASLYGRVTGKDISLSWTLADTMSRRGKELYNESVVAKVLERNPEDVVKTVFQKNALTETRELTRALENNPTALNNYRRSVVEELIKEATNPSTNRVVGETFAKKARSRGEEMLKLTFGENYKQFNKILEIAERMPSESKAGMLWFEQGLYLTSGVAAIGGHAFDSTGAMVAAGAAPVAWFLGTKQLASILTDPQKTTKLLSVYSMKPGTQAFVRNLMELGAISLGEQGERFQVPPQQVGTLTQPSMGNLQ